MTIDDALDGLFDRGASDILISCGSPPRLRTDGRLEPVSGPMLTPERIEGMLRGLLDEGQWAELQRRRHIDFAFTWLDRIRVRGNVFFQRGSLAAAFRMLPTRIPTFEELGVPDSVRLLADRHQGLVLVTGPNGSGKSTTQAAMIDYINHHRACHIVTIEDPIEYVHQHDRAMVAEKRVLVSISVDSTYP